MEGHLKSRKSKNSKRGGVRPGAGKRAVAIVTDAELAEAERGPVPTPEDAIAVARRHLPEAMSALASVATEGKRESARIAACVTLIEIAALGGDELPPRRRN
jgi:hypothetical protein